MAFWIFMLIMNLMIPVTMIGFGYLFLKHPPRHINGLFGYRTAMSMKSQETWDFAQHCLGKWWLVLGCILLPVTVAVMMFFNGESTDKVGIGGGIICLIQCIPMIGSIYPVEKGLKRNFDKAGKRI